MSSTIVLLDLAEPVAALCLPETVDRRLQRLMDRNTDGKLSVEEREELAGLVELSEEISLLRSRALSILGRRPE